ncbi:cytochrome c oxidase, cbb3-type, CcoQ subunit [Sulfurospirillum diekertiae]|uniref:Cytochrome c oxidase, cbb3-type, CcoQ subunit n=2 Tax=Sulfurospirillum diekertiae TaxID=1854492 RepID=A0A6G9VT46_9BACT|nr:cytochrome c oxidase, cbb3-type, CcoQ subunit [Sulfurospirillum diekertiae]QIR75545.1 cytochrome c oxidase, cbb3-type, CcoQ subunit [Sulfurospirillum diekertiae]QIR78194.1 cytochrome c oxidase, cbb3-type, CcoQ subunit [Sulfurospirillum diekertiae]
MSMETIREIQAYAYVVATVFLVVMMYGYLYHLYKAEKKGTRNYEQYGDIALHDNIDDTPVETRTPSNKEKE